MQLAGYEWLTNELGLDLIPHYCSSYILASGTRHSEQDQGIRREYYTKQYAMPEKILPQVEFALKFDGVNLAIIKRALQRVPPEEVAEYVSARPTSENRRRIWFYYESFTGKHPPLDDLKQGNYASLLKEDEYFVGPAVRVQRQRIRNNLPGSTAFCPLVRKTELLTAYVGKDLKKRCLDLVADYSTDQLKRAMRYLFTKETRSSFEIEKQRPDPSKTERFVALLQASHTKCRFDEEFLVNLQHAIVDPRYHAEGLRDLQNYIGQSTGFGEPNVHCVFPKAEDLPELMQGWQSLSENLARSDHMHPVIAATLVAFGFVFLHPFEDGNGRIHRLLIHQVLAHRGYTPEGLIFPVSAAMVNDEARYDDALESFSRPLMTRVEYTLNDDHEITVQNDTVDHYRYIDMTPMAEALFYFIERTIEDEFVQELNYLRNYDEAKPALQEIVDMPGHRLDLFIKCCLQNQGRLAARKRNTFNELEDDEVEAMQNVVQEIFLTTPKN